MKTVRLVEQMRLAHNARAHIQICHAKKSVTVKMKSR